MPPKMFPPALPEEVLSDPKRSGEVQVFDAIKNDKNFDDRWRVFYSLDWIAEYGGFTRDGEADFVIAHPDVGYLVIEVKGGIVTVKPGPTWQSVDRDGEKHSIQNGMRQAMKSKKVVLDALKEAWGRSPPFFRGRHGVILPHSSEPHNSQGDLAKGLPRDLFVFKGQMDRLGRRIRELLNWNAPGADDKIGMGGEKGVRILEGLYGKEIELSPVLKDEINDVERRILELSENQKKVLGLVRRQKKCLIQGAAGTGKTVIAKERALRGVKAGENVLFVCFNRLLRERVEDELRSDLSAEERSRLSVCTFHGLCLAVSGREIEAGEMEAEYFNQILPDAFYEVILDAEIDTASLPIAFDTLIIDEGQDFTDEWIGNLLDLGSMNEADSLIFQDANQCIYRSNNFPEILGVEPITLSENFRNSREIFEIVSTYVDDSEFISMGPHGPSVRSIAVSSSEITDVLNNEIDTLIETEGVSPDDIVVLTGSSQKGHVAYTTHGSIVFRSIWEYKGLDSSVVILTDIENALRKPELAYVGLSRARSLLLLIDTQEHLLRLLSVLPAQLQSVDALS